MQAPKICNVCGCDTYYCYRCRLNICFSTHIVDNNGHHCFYRTEISPYGGIHPSQRHLLCVECTLNTTCDITSTCVKCLRNVPFHMITPTVAIGSCLSPYDTFDTIINLHLGYNATRVDEITETPFTEGSVVGVGAGYDNWKKWVGNPSKKIIFCGIDDKDNALSIEKLDRIVALMGENPGRILFHCAMGISRSTTAAIYYLSKTLGITTREAYQLARAKRKMVCPNNGFMKLLGLV